jgi:hypothetical protein
VLFSVRAASGEACSVTSVICLTAGGCGLRVLQKSCAAGENLHLLL